MEYDSGDEETVYYKIKKSKSFIIIDFDENKTITKISSDSKYVSDSNGVLVGEPVLNALGKAAYCNTFYEDSPAYCSVEKGSKYIYEISYDENCLLPSARWEKMDIPPCVKIQGITVTIP
jgi:hypothetical protein